MVLTLIARSPWEPGFLAPIARCVRHACELGLSVGRPGPHAFAVRDVIARLAKPSRPSHPRLTCRDDRDTPSSSRRDSADEITDLGSRSRQILKISIAVLRHVGTTGNERMAPMRELPVVQTGCASLGERLLHAGRQHSDVVLAKARTHDHRPSCLSRASATVA
jgi:hypothetical protein